jgi:phosphatidylglycerophosphatase A
VTGAPPDAPPPPLRGATDIVAHVLSVWFGCGHAPFAPGTAGTLGAIPLYLLLRPHGPVAVAIAAVVVTAIGLWSSGRVERRLRIEDPQIVCIDEVAGVLVTWIAAPMTTRALIVGFVAFRVFDHLKPWPANKLQELPGGRGIMLDDIAAGVWGAAVLLVGRALGWL